MSYHVLAVTQDRRWLMPLQERLPEVVLEQVRDETELKCKLDEDDRSVHAVLVGADQPDPLGVAQTVMTATKDPAVLMLCRADELGNLKKRLLFAPFLTQHVACLSVENLGDVRKELDVAVRDAEQRRQHRSFVVALEGVRTTEGLRRPSGTRYFEKLLDIAPVGVVIADEQGIVLGWNRAACRVFGREEREALGRSFPSLFPPATASAVTAFLSEARQASEPLIRVFSRHVGSSTAQALELRAAVIESQEGNQAFLLLVQDVTERIEVEQQIQELNRQLGARIKAHEATQAELQARIEDLEGFHDVVVGRELKMMELEREVERLRKKLGEAG